GRRTGRPRPRRRGGGVLRPRRRTGVPPRCPHLHGHRRGLRLRPARHPPPVQERGRPGRVVPVHVHPRRAGAVLHRPRGRARRGRDVTALGTRAVRRPGRRAARAERHAPPGGLTQAVTHRDRPPAGHLSRTPPRPFTPPRGPLPQDARAVTGAHPCFSPPSSSPSCSPWSCSCPPTASSPGTPSRIGRAHV